MTERDASQQIVITGMGMVSPLGLDVESSWRRLVNGEHAVRDVRASHLTAYSEAKLPYSLGAPVEGFDLVANNPFFDRREIRKDLKEYHLSAQFALEAAYQALKQAGLIDAPVEPERFGVSIGSGIGGGDMIGEARRIIDAPEEDPDRIRNYYILHALPNRVSEVPSMVFGAKAFGDAMFSECATGISNIQRAADEIRLGRADVVAAGGAETGITPVAMALFGATRALGKDNAPRPFDKAADGIVMGEGAGVVVVESLEHARRRGAVVLAELVGYGRSSDAYQPTFPSGEGATRAINTALKEAGLKASDITDAYINAHATGTQGDGIEMQAIAEVFKPEQAAGVSSTKGATGHTLGAAGGVETIFGVKALQENIVPPSLKLDDPVDATDGWNMSPYEATPATVEFVIKNAFGFGGLNNVIILKKAS